MLITEKRPTGRCGDRANLPRPEVNTLINTAHFGRIVNNSNEATEAGNRPVPPQLGAHHGRPARLCVRDVRDKTAVNPSPQQRPRPSHRGAF